jgi:hypothetical protein
MRLSNGISLFCNSARNISRIFRRDAEIRMIERILFKKTNGPEIEPFEHTEVKENAAVVVIAFRQML